MKTLSLLTCLFCLTVCAQTNWVGPEAYNQVLNDLGYTNMAPTQVINYTPTHRQLVFASTNGVQFIVVANYTTNWAESWGYAERAYWYPSLGAPYRVDRYIEDQFFLDGGWYPGNPLDVTGLSVYK